MSKSSADVTVTDNNCIYVSILSFVKEEAAEGRGGGEALDVVKVKVTVVTEFLKSD